jgi:RND family efflux transporter MFP subunit
MTKRLKAISVFACQSILAISVAACSVDADNKQTDSQPVPVVVGKVQKVQEPETIAVSGTVTTPNSPARVSFLVSGKVVLVGPREGEYVRKGQMLASIDPTDYQLALTAATMQADMARIAFGRAEDEHRRMKMLYDSESLAPNDYEKYKAGYESSRQQYEQDTALENISRKHLADTELRSPVSGFISKRSIEPGETASPGQPVFEIVNLDTVEVSVGVPETDVHIVHVGQKAAITLPALPGESFKGVVRLVNVSADSGTRTYMTRISIPNSKHTLRIGMVAEARIRGDKFVKLLTAPIHAIVRDPQGAMTVYVYYPGQKRVYAKRVEIGTLGEKDLEIRSGLTEDDWIVFAGQTRIMDGTVVSATEQQTLKVASMEGVRK